MSNNKGKFCPNRDVFSRMNFLYQAALLMGGRNNKLSSYYGSLCKNVGKKAVLRLEPSIKRSLCKKCGIALKPSITSEFKLDKKNKKLFLIKCKLCSSVKKFIINPKYNFWLDNPESVVETYEESKRGKDVNLNINKNNNDEHKNKPEKKIK